MNTNFDPSSTSAVDSGAPSNTGIDELLGELSLVANPLQDPPRAAIHRLALAAHQSCLLSAVVGLKRLECVQSDSVRGIAKTPLSALAFSLIADVSAVASQLMDKKGVTGDTYLEKLSEDTAGKIAKTRARLMDEREHLGAAIAWFESGTDPDSFRRVRGNDPSSDAVYHEIERRAACLLACQVAIAAALTGPNDVADDWPPQGKPVASAAKHKR